MADILNYKFYLNFKNEGSFGRLEITEPIGFDGASFVVEQESKRYGRDAYKINEEISLNFYKGNWDATNELQELPNGTVIYNLTQGYEYLIDCYNRYGFESDVDFEIELDGLMFIPANLDFQTSETDGFSYFSCKALQQSDKQLLKRRTDLVVDVFSDEDIDGSPITPLVAENILLKSKPVVQDSEWISPNSLDSVRFFASEGTSDTQYYYYNNCQSLIVSGIENSLSFLSQIEADLTNENFNLASNFGYVEALDDLENVIINISDLVFEQTIDTDNGGDGFAGNFFRIAWGTNLNTPDGFIDVDTSTVTDSDGFYTFSVTDEDYIIPLVQRGSKIWIFFRTRVRQSSDTPFGNPTIEAFTSVSSYKIKIKATSIAIDTVIKGVRWIDVIKQNVKSISGFDVYAPQLDVGGEHYDNFAFTGNLIKRRDDVAFPVKFDDLMEMLQEHNADYQIIDGTVYINNYENFYPNKEIGVLLTSPDDSFKSTFNPRFALNQFELGYKEFEQDKDEGNTIDAVHTSTQWSLDNKQVENDKKIDLKQIRDPFKIQFSVNEAVKKTTSTSDEDKLFLVDVVPLAPNRVGEFTASMTHNILVEDGITYLQLLKDANLPSWGVLGFDVGTENFVIDGQENDGVYTVIEIEDTIIKLQSISASVNFEGTVSTTVVYPYTNVFYTNRTNEDFTVIENVLSPEKFSNLLYTPKRNIEKWESYLATASIYKPNGSFRNRYFRNNGELTTRFGTETVNTIEKADIPNTDLPNPILTPYLYETKLVTPFDTMSAIITAINTINEDNSIGGFIRCIDNNNKVIRLYPQKLDYVPSTETLVLNGEQKFDGNGVDIVVSGGIVTVNEVGYAIDELSAPFYEFDGDYFKIYDKDKLPVINPTRFDDITVNGLSFDSSSDLLGYLVDL